MVWNTLHKNNGNVLCNLKKKKNAAQKNSSATRTNRLIFLSNCAVCGMKKPRFIKNQEATRLELH